MTDNVLDLTGKTALVVGGSSGIGNGIAREFLARGATVHVWGTRASALDYEGENGSDLRGLHYAQVDVADHAALARFEPAFDRLDVLVLAQGLVKYRRQEYEIETFRHVVDVNLNSVMHCCLKFHAHLTPGPRATAPCCANRACWRRSPARRCRIHASSRVVQTKAYSARCST
jgi:3-oxoacyl-[acyl-carrier protein] reductase